MKSSRSLLYSMFIAFAPQDYAPNGLRYPRVGGTRPRRFDGTNLKPSIRPENAATPTRRVHAVLGGLISHNCALVKAIENSQL